MPALVLVLVLMLLGLSVFLFLFFPIMTVVETMMLAMMLLKPRVLLIEREKAEMEMVMEVMMTAEVVGLVEVEVVEIIATLTTTTTLIVAAAAAVIAVAVVALPPKVRKFEKAGEDGKADGKEKKKGELGQLREFQDDDSANAAVVVAGYNCKYSHEDNEENDEEVEAKGVEAVAEAEVEAAEATANQDKAGQAQAVLRRRRLSSFSQALSKTQTNLLSTLLTSSGGGGSGGSRGGRPDGGLRALALLSVSALILLPHKPLLQTSALPRTITKLMGPTIMTLTLTLAFTFTCPSSLQHPATSSQQPTQPMPALLLHSQTPRNYLTSNEQKKGNKRNLPVKLHLEYIKNGTMELSSDGIRLKLQVYCLALILVKREVKLGVNNRGDERVQRVLYETMGKSQWEQGV
ncbi:hypothetical protein K435DRAFT_806544 [Dendrothele bispora CBS 962.96]|uniref:Uncharacterized protein n=1 Tax=Dendrothele bispora (strain CBS 962.96) TaxID=1314807 RepID=A0A4S8L7H4_DENBC|nr:hypothetical protein K435DRAFT_806544 [Dendrothele bispora CBS 962.96]